MKKDEKAKPSPALDYYQVTHLAASAIRTSTQSLAIPKPFECKVCGSCWPSDYQLIQHVRIHTGEKPFRCSYCPRFFRQKSTLNDHEKMHRNERPHRCSFCSKAFVTPSNLRHHMLRVHSGLKFYDCPECPEKFFDLTTARIHRIRKHGGEFPYPCSHCDKKFVERSHLNKHLHDIHGIMPYSCLKCDQKFRLQRELLCHEGTHEDDDDETLYTSTTKQSMKSPVSQLIPVPAKSLNNGHKVNSPVPSAKAQSSQLNKKLQNKLIKQNKVSKAVTVEKREFESEEEISVLYEGKKQVGNLVEKEKLDKFRKRKELKTDDFKNQVDSMAASSPTYKIQTVETPADDQKDNLPSKKKYFCSCGNSYKSIDKFRRHQQRNEGHQDATVVTQQPSSSLIEVEESPKKKITVEKVQVKNEKREEPQIETSAKKKRKRMKVKTEPENISRIEEPSPKTKRKMLQLSANNDEMETEMCEESFKKKHHCVCGKSYKSVEKFQRHQHRNGHDNNAKVEEGRKQQLPSSQNSASCQQLTTKNQEVKEEYHKFDKKSPVVENAKVSIKKKVQQVDVDTKDSEVVVVVKCDRQQIKREKLDNSVVDIKVETADLKIKTQFSSFDGEVSKKKRCKKIKLEQVPIDVEHKQKENKAKLISKCEVRMKKMKTEDINKDSKPIPNNKLKVKTKKEIRPLSTMASQLSTINRGEKKQNQKKEDIKEESQEDEVEILEVKLVKKQDDKNLEEKCSCGKLFSSPEKFQRHRERKGHHIPKTYKCFCSSQVFNNLEDFRSHMWANHRS